MPPPLGPEIDATPRPLPARMPLAGRSVTLEPLSTEEASRVWTLFPAVNYRTSVGYIATPVWIDYRDGRVLVPTPDDPLD